MPLKDMLLCCLSKKGLITAFEPRNYFKEKGDFPMQLRALVSGMYDVLNHFYLDIGNVHVSASENEPAKQNFIHFREMGITQPALTVFDRGYLSIELIDFLETEGIHYFIRLSSNDYKAERKQMQPEDEKVILKHSSARLQKIRQKHPGRYEHLKKKEETAVRIP